MKGKKNEETKPAAARPPRVLVPELAAYRGSSEEILLRKEETAHVRSRRLREGDEVVALDGKGERARACLTRSGTALKVLSFEEDPGLLSPSSSAFFASLPGEPDLRVTVLLACAEPARVEWAIEKGTECGAAGFVLLSTARSQKAHVTALEARLSRLSRIAAEATKQCDRTIVPGIEGPEEIEEFLRGEEGRRHARRPFLLTDPWGAPLVETISSASFSSSLAGGVAVAVGPEGGFTPAEISLFEGFGALRVSLGPRILRLETAVVAALTLLVGRPDR
ncbi:MAG: RsmE family RNA methyltransferase [Thermoanaerobaculia bacterium]